MFRPALLLLASCASRAPAAPAPNTCEAAAVRLGQSLSANYQWRAQQRKELANDTDVARHRSFVTRTIAVVCERDTWSADAIACFASAKVETTAEPGQGDVNTCAKKLGFEQSNAFRAAFRPYGKSEHAAPCP